MGAEAAVGAEREAAAKAGAEVEGCEVRGREVVMREVVVREVVVRESVARGAGETVAERETVGGRRPHRQTQGSM